MTLSKYDTDFANAMALKLRLNREAGNQETAMRLSNPKSMKQL